MQSKYTFFFSYKFFRLKKASTSSPVGPSDENVYNPSRDLFSKTSTPATTTPTPAATLPVIGNKDNIADGGIKDVYSPTQDVEDFYRPPPQPTSGLRPPGGPPPSGLGGSGYNPRTDLINNQQPGVWDTNYDNSNQRSNYYQDGQNPIQNQNNSAPAPVRGDPRANRRDPRRRD